MKKKIKKLRADLAFNIIGFIVLLLLLLSLITGVVGYAGFTAAFQKEYAESTFHMANTAAALVHGDRLDSYLTDIHGEIRRGLITDPETGEQVLGIAVAEQLHFTGQTHTRDGLVYYELSPGQTLGLYTATGWQFWINGAKRGWFDSSDSMLHVTHMRAVDSIDLGDSWRLSSAGGLGIRYIGG